MTTGRAIADANALTSRWASTLDNSGTVLSGAGVHVLLALLAPFAGGRVRDDLLAIAPEQLDLPDSPATRMATGVWTRAEVPLTEDWKAAVPEPLRGALTGDPAVDQPVLDAWAARQTDGEIAAMPVQVTDGTLMVLASALSVRTTWAEPFTDDLQESEDGAWAGRQQAGLHRMTKGAGALQALRVVETAAGALTLVTVVGADDVDVVLALGEAGAPPAVVLPAAIDAAVPPGSGDATKSPRNVTYGDTLLERATIRQPEIGGSGQTPVAGAPGVSVRECQASDDQPELHVHTVRFRVTGSHDLLEHAEIFGLAGATDASRGHFPGISPMPMAISQARQDAVAEFTAEGFKAAAVTAFATLAGAYFQQVTYRKRIAIVDFDRPFGFVAVHRPTGLALVAGWVSDPEPFEG
ncbi:serpin family protein [Dactylosporangium sp. CA-233914]|uniref:serpin family protein n=1 Tax=Dactylosporangium sp. CA-233914 TaxID=3239934 RepID=UPI003D8D6E50